MGTEAEVSGFPGMRKVAEEHESEKEVEEEGRGTLIPLHCWVMHGAIMFGREFCYAMENALVMPTLLQIGLPDQYYSLTWILSPFLGLLFTPLIGTASDRCTLKWGRRRPFILCLCVGVLLGMTLFLNGSLIGLSMGDKLGSQTIGIALTVVGVVVLDFSADASEGPISAYLLDVADTEEEQDMGLNIHNISAGLGGAVGYVLGGLDWTDTALGQAFKSQEQVLFLFAGIIFIISVTLHMLSIPELPFAPSNKLRVTGSSVSSSHSSFRPIGPTPPSLDVIAVEDVFAPLVQRDNKPGLEEREMDFLAVERGWSKSDSVLYVPDATITLDDDLNPDKHLFLPEAHHFLQDTQGDLDIFKPLDHSVRYSSPPDGLTEAVSGPEGPINGSALPQQVKATCANAGLSSSAHSNVEKCHASTRLTNHPTNTSVLSRPHPPIFYRIPSFTLSSFGRVGSRRYRLRRATQPITTFFSLNDLSDVQRRPDRRTLLLSASSLLSDGSDPEGGPATVRLLWLSMLRMPRQLLRLCLCHLITWFSILAVVVFYTDFMGQVVYHGDPTAPANSTELHNYNRGVQMGCWGLVVYAVTAAVCSAMLQKFLDNFDLKAIYIVGTLVFSIGTAVIAIFPNVYVAIVMISGMGVITMSVSYCPYVLLGQYHEIKEYVHHSPANTRRGFGIDCAILSCQVYISQILVASALGAVVKAVGSVRVVPAVASGGSFLGFLAACFLVIYPDV